ncbi:hypothetical protein [Microbulbifer taiwanensis]|uniref:Uncharacterized protein n=1 Tax=Microbulbifer taiwanensis TaxID=986746 RepID=A0ABW1YJ85_9GAMM|nr:hypothetical protein [Microbulbifer taiwanensis]
MSESAVVEVSLERMREIYDAIGEIEWVLLRVQQLESERGQAYALGYLESVVDSVRKQLSGAIPESVYEKLVADADAESAPF